MKMRTDILAREQEILKWIEENQSKAFICRNLQCKPETLNSYLQKMGIQYNGNKGGKGFERKTIYKTALEYSKGINVKSHILKQKLIREGIKEDKCEICGISIWQNVKLPLELHHKNGNHFDNDFDNLQILCPNCHSIQEGNSGANVGKYVSVLEQVDTSLLDSDAEKRVGSSPTTNTKKNFCCDCGKEISLNALRCRTCASKLRKSINCPSREILKKLIRTMPFTKIGEKYGVSDNAVRKWCKNNNLPYQSSKIKEISDEDWENI